MASLGGQVRTLTGRPEISKARNFQDLLFAGEIRDINFSALESNRLKTIDKSHLGNSPLTRLSFISKYFSISCSIYSACSDCCKPETSLMSLPDLVTM